MVVLEGEQSTTLDFWLHPNHAGIRRHKISLTTARPAGRETFGVRRRPFLKLSRQSAYFQKFYDLLLWQVRVLLWFCHRTCDSSDTVVVFNVSFFYFDNFEVWFSLSWLETSYTGLFVCCKTQPARSPSVFIAQWIKIPNRCRWGNNSRADSNMKTKTQQNKYLLYWQFSLNFYTFRNVCTVLQMSGIHLLNKKEIFVKLWHICKCFFCFMLNKKAFWGDFMLFYNLL